MELAWRYTGRPAVVTFSNALCFSSRRELFLIIGLTCFVVRLRLPIASGSVSVLRSGRGFQRLGVGCPQVRDRDVQGAIDGPCQ